MRGTTEDREEEEFRAEPEKVTTESDESPKKKRKLKPKERVAELESECEELRTKWMRAQADYQNLKRRNAAEYEMGLKRALNPLFTDLLLVADYLDMALAMEPTSDEAKNLAMGVEMTRTKLLQSLEGAEVHPIATEGVFDPELHEATGTEEREDLPPGTILRVVRKGYTWRETVLRHAHVIVVAGHKEAGAEEAETEAEED